MTAVSKSVRLTDLRPSFPETGTGSPICAADKNISQRRNRACSIHRDAPTRVPVQTHWTTNDIVAFGATLALVFLGTVLAANTNHPIFWLLLGPGPLAVGFTVISFLRQGFRRRQSSLLGRHSTDRAVWSRRWA
jgi:hypothetical protein